MKDKRQKPILHKNASKYQQYASEKSKNGEGERTGKKKQKQKQKRKQKRRPRSIFICPSHPSIKREILFLRVKTPSSEITPTANKPPFLTTASICPRDKNHLTYLALRPAKASGLCLPLPAKPWKSLLSWLTCLAPLPFMATGAFACGICCCCCCCCCWLNGFMFPLRGIVALRWGACICCCCVTGTLSSGRDWRGRWGASWG